MLSGTKGAHPALEVIQILHSNKYSAELSISIAGILFGTINRQVDGLGMVSLSELVSESGKQIREHDKINSKI